MACLLASFNLAGVSSLWASLAAFTVIGAGGLGSLLAGRLADRWGRTTLTIASLSVSGACAMGVGLFYGGNRTNNKRNTETGRYSHAT